MQSCMYFPPATAAVNVAASVLSILVIGLVVAIILCVSCCVKRYKKKSGEGIYLCVMLYNVIFCYIPQCIQ